MTQPHPALTKNQSLVLATLEQAAAPMSAYAILDGLRDHGFRAPLQVYRALDRLREQGLVHRIESLNAFVACSHSQCHSNGIISFAICDTCDNVLEFSDDVLTERLSSWSETKGFIPTSTSIEIRGTCQSCSAA